MPGLVTLRADPALAPRARGTGGGAPMRSMAVQLEVALRERLAAVGAPPITEDDVDRCAPEHGCIQRKRSCHHTHRHALHPSRPRVRGYRYPSCARITC